MYMKSNTVSIVRQSAANTKRKITQEQIQIDDI